MKLRQVAPATMIYKQTNTKLTVTFKVDTYYLKDVPMRRLMKKLEDRGFKSNSNNEFLYIKKLVFTYQYPFSKGMQDEVDKEKLKVIEMKCEFVSPMLFAGLETYG